MATSLRDAGSKLNKLLFEVARVGNSRSTTTSLGFWQEPCATEKQAFLNHTPNLAIVENKQTDLYLGLPWATYIDRKSFPTGQIASVKEAINAIGAPYAPNMKIHTVCQHIYWRHAVEEMEKAGITDLYISHMLPDSEGMLADFLGRPTKIQLHAWPLMAANIENADRRQGLAVGDNDIEKRRFLVSFIGATMPHYMSRTREQIKRHLEHVKRPDIVIEVRDRWHFDAHVYGEQMGNCERSAKEIRDEQRNTEKYNQVLSNSKFALCPPGAGPNTVRLWEAMALGVLPIVIDPIPSVLKNSEQGRRILEASIYWDGPVDERLLRVLETMPVNELRARSAALRQIYPTFRNKTCFQQIL